MAQRTRGVHGVSPIWVWKPHIGPKGVSGVGQTTRSSMSENRRRWTFPLQNRENVSFLVLLFHWALNKLADAFMGKGIPSLLNLQTNVNLFQKNPLPTHQKVMLFHLFRYLLAKSGWFLFLFYLFIHFWITAILTGVKWNRNEVMIWISLIAKDEHFSYIYRSFVFILLGSVQHVLDCLILANRFLNLCMLPIFNSSVPYVGWFL